MSSSENDIPTDLPPPAPGPQFPQPADSGSGPAPPTLESQPAPPPPSKFAVHPETAGYVNYARACRELEYTYLQIRISLDRVDGRTWQYGYQRGAKMRVDVPTGSPDQILSAVAREGWRLVQAGFTFRHEGQKTRENSAFLSDSKSNTVTAGTTVGTYVFERVTRD